MTSATFPIVGIGASAGGIDAFRQLFHRIPADCGMAFIVILHLPADRKSMLGEILKRWTPMAVVEALDGTRIEPNHVYVPPPHAIVTVVDEHLRVSASLEGEGRVFRPIDTLFDALAAALHERAVGIVLSGTGSDGALGVKAIKECGGLTIAQGKNGASPQYGEMPAGAISTGAIDLVLPAEEMAGHLMRLKSVSVDMPGPEGRDVDAALHDICAILRTQLGHDFSGYRSQTFLRRVARRMQIVNVTDLDGYIENLKASPEEVIALFRDLLIRVTSFFRDEETFAVLADKVIPRLFEGRAADGMVRLWVPGCATGEEAYSLAILLREYMDTLAVIPKVQIFATDIDELAIGTARLGRYPETLLKGLSRARQERFFKLEHGGWCVTKEIRDLCTFSVHNVVRDPPFSMMSLVSCRNLLIYMNPELQARVIPLFHYALITGGILLLGGSESVAQHGHLFETLSKTARIFIRRPGRSPHLDLTWRRAQSPHPGQASAHLKESDRGAAPRQAVGPGPMMNPSANGRVDVTISRFAHLLGSAPVSAEILSQLQVALASTCEELDSLRDDHQTALEELRSANEELHSVNEELQSTNEELETSKEELQSLNEELQTVNVRLTEKIDELDHANSDLRNLFDSTQIATVFLDRQLIVRSFTPAIASLYNLIPSDQGRRPLTDIVSHLQYKELPEDVNFVLASMKPLERRVESEDGLVHYVMRILPYREPDSSVSGVLVTFVDVSSIVQAEAALLAADVRKDVFLATLSHELRNPLAPIRIAAELLQAPKLEPDQLKHARDVISRQVTHLSSLLDDLLDVSRITRGSFLLKKKYVDLNVLIDEAVETAHSMLEAKEHTLRREDSPAPIRLEVDPVRITQVLANLLTNAVKYTPQGGLIHVGSRFEGAHLVIFVRDNGVGLHVDSIGKVFDMFTRVESEIGRAEGGLGIGLALAKGLVELHGGRLQVRSAGRGQGSEFAVFLPRALVVDEAVVPAGPAGDIDAYTKPRRILVADDNRDSATTLGMLLGLLGHEVHLAHSGAEALEVAKRVRPEIGVFDIGMPDVSGYEVAERIRLEAWGQDILLIAVTGWGQESDKRRAIAAGFDHHMTKPVDSDQLALLFDGSR